MSSVTREALLSGEKRDAARQALEILILLRESPWLRDVFFMDITIDTISALTVEAIEERNARRYGGREEGS